MGTLGRHELSDAVALDRWDPPDYGGIYAVSCSVVDTSIHCLIYIGMTESFSKRGIASHEKRWCWNSVGEFVRDNLGGGGGAGPGPGGADLRITRAADGVPLYVSTMRVESEGQRRALEAELVDRYKPPCNGELEYSRDDGCYVPASPQPGSPQLSLFVGG